MKNRLLTFVLIILALTVIFSAITINAFAVTHVGGSLTGTVWRLQANPWSNILVNISGVVYYDSVDSPFTKVSITADGTIQFNINEATVYHANPGEYVIVSFTSDPNNVAFTDYVVHNGTRLSSVPTDQFVLYHGNGSIIGTYSYTEGMTWGEWVNSSFNVDGFEISDVYADDAVPGGGRFDVYRDAVIVEWAIDSDGFRWAETVNVFNGLPVSSSDIINSSSYTQSTYLTVTQDYADGYDRGYYDGYDDGFEEGYQLGVNDGYNQGVDETFAEDLLGSTLETPFNALREFVLFEANGIEVNALSIIYALIGFGLFMFILKMIAGG